MHPVKSIYAIMDLHLSFFAPSIPFLIRLSCFIVFFTLLALLCMCKAIDDSSGELEPIDSWEEEDETEPEVWFQVLDFKAHIENVARYLD